MRILADENIPRVIVTALRAAGHDVHWITETSPGIADRDVLTLAGNEQRVLLTFDRDFGELVFRHQQPVPDGVILLRIPSFLPDKMASFVTQVLTSRNDWTQHFAVIDEHNIRMIPLAYLPQN